MGVGFVDLFGGSFVLFGVFSRALDWFDSFLFSVAVFVSLV